MGFSFRESIYRERSFQGFWLSLTGWDPHLFPYWRLLRGCYCWADILKTLTTPGIRNSCLHRRNAVRGGKNWFLVISSHSLTNGSIFAIEKACQIEKLSTIQQSQQFKGKMSWDFLTCVLREVAIYGCYGWFDLPNVHASRNINLGVVGLLYYCEHSGR